MGYIKKNIKKRICHASTKDGAMIELDAELMKPLCFLLKNARLSRTEILEKSFGSEKQKLIGP